MQNIIFYHRAKNIIIFHIWNICTQDGPISTVRQQFSLTSFSFSKLFMTHVCKDSLNTLYHFLDFVLYSLQVVTYKPITPVLLLLPYTGPAWSSVRHTFF